MEWCNSLEDKLADTIERVEALEKRRNPGPREIGDWERVKEQLTEANETCARLRAERDNERSWSAQLQGAIIGCAVENPENQSIARLLDYAVTGGE